METPKIFPVKISNKGFTLLEILVVVGILAAVVAFGLPKIKNNQNNIKTVARQMASLSREIRNQARVKQMTFRLVLKINGEESSYWVENAPGNTLIPSQETLESVQQMDEKERPSNPFSKNEKLVKKDRLIPPGLSIGSVETPNMPNGPATNGLAYVYYSPEGLVEHAVIQLTSIAKERSPLTWSLVFNPLTGHVDILEKPITLRDLAF
jgi:general secretion pathway protein H